MEALSADPLAKEWIKSYVSERSYIDFSVTERIFVCVSLVKTIGGRESVQTVLWQDFSIYFDATMCNDAH